MNEKFIPDNIQKADRSDFATFLDTTPNGQSMTFKILGIGITDFGIDFNPQTETEKWIIEKNSRTDHTGNQKQGDVNQKIYKNDPCYTFVYAGMDKTNYKTHILDIDYLNGSGGSYPAKLSDGKVVIDSFLGENAELGYTLHYEGDPKEGTATISNDTVTFTPTASL